MESFWQFIVQNAAPLQALASIVTVLVAIGAAIIALNQMKASYKIHREQAQPYVAAGMRTLDEVDSSFVEFYIHNFGLTAAHNICVTSSPPLMSAMQGEEPEEMWLFDTLPTLVPGDEWTQLMGYAPSHFSGSLPVKYEVTIQWKDSAGESFEYVYVLDWEAHKHRHLVSQRTVHHLVGATKEIQKELKNLRQALQDPKSGDAD